MRPFEPSLQAAQAALAAAHPADYARTRKFLEGAVTGLSPYLTHGFLGLSEVFAAVHARRRLDQQHKFVFELGWRAYWRHVWFHLGAGIHRSIHAGLLPDDHYISTMPSDVTEARTGIPVIDLAVRELYARGYLHNHARMWLASYLVHLRKVHWHTGAQWMVAHLLDGDLASNHLSWQWVAGTGSVKPYLFNAENVAKYAPAPWHCPGSVIDTSYEALDRLARSPEPVLPEAAGSRGRAPTPEPALHAAPTAPEWLAPDSALADGRDVWLMHPWALAGPPSQASADGLCIGLALTEFHAPNPWSARRWAFVTGGMRQYTAHLWAGSSTQIAQALQRARSIRWQSEPHADPALARLSDILHSSGPRPVVAPTPEPTSLFEPVADYCNSFSKWWRSTRIRPDDLLA